MTDRVLWRGGATIEATFWDGTEPVAADGSVTVTITRADGSPVATAAATTSPSPGVYAYDLAPQASLNLLVASWTGTFGGTPRTISTAIEIVGGWVVELAALRAKLPDSAAYPVHALVDGRSWFTDKLEAYVGVAMAPRYDCSILSGNGWSDLLYPRWPVRRVLSAAESSGGTWADIDGDEIEALVLRDYGSIRRRNNSWPAGEDNLRLEVEHGLETVPAEVTDVAVVAIVDKLQRDTSGSARAERQFSVATGESVVRISMPGPDRPFGIPAVDQVANELRSRYRVPAVA